MGVTLLEKQRNLYPPGPALPKGGDFIFISKKRAENTVYIYIYPVGVPRPKPFYFVFFLWPSSKSMAKLKISPVGTDFQLVENCFAERAQKKLFSISFFFLFSKNEFFYKNIDKQRIGFFLSRSGG